MKNRSIQRYGWRPDFPDYRDWYYKNTHSPQALGAVVSPTNVTPAHSTSTVSNGVVTPDMNTPVSILPQAVSLRPKAPPIQDQGQLGSCSAHAANGMWEYVHGGGPYSRLQIYYDERAIEGTVSSDSGAQMRDAIRVLVETGAGQEADWPYDITKFADTPPAKELTEAATDKATSYSRLNDGTDFTNCLAQGFPFIIGFSVYSSFEGPDVAQTGIVPMPTDDDQMEGGHAVCVVGYNNNFNGTGQKYYEVRNSWGTSWGDNGYFWLPAEYLENPDLAADAWTIRK